MSNISNKNGCIAINVVIHNRAMICSKICCTNQLQAMRVSTKMAKKSKNFTTHRFFVHKCSHYTETKHNISATTINNTTVNNVTTN